MKRAGRLIFAVLLVLFVCLRAAAASAAATADPRTLTYEIPRSERFSLPNGLVVHLLSDRTLPWVRMAAYINVGAIYEPADKPGLAALTGGMIRDGGIAGKTPDEVDAELDFMASAISASSGDDAGILTLTALTRHFPATLQLFAGMLTAPAFDEGRFVQSVNAMIEALRRQNDDPRQVAERELDKAVYGAHPLGRYPSPTTVRAVGRADLAAFHRRYVHPNNIVLAIFRRHRPADPQGDIDRGPRRLAAIDPGIPAVPLPVKTLKPAVLFSPKGIVQSVIRMGHLGITKDNPDLYALRVMDFILGAGGFNSRLMSQIRSDEGLAYSVWSKFEVGWRFPGLFSAGTKTKSATTGRAIGLMRTIMGDMTRQAVTAQELALAKDSIVDAERIVNQRARIEFYGYPKDYLENYRDRIAAVTAEEVLRVARTYLHPEKLVAVVGGDAAGFDRPLSDFGEVRETKPEP